jgi:hypothetical protein
MMMKKLLLFVFGIGGALAYGDSTKYTLLSTMHPDKIAVKEEKQIPIQGYDSSGHTITLYQTVSTEKYYDLYEAFDIGVRYHANAMVLAAIEKLRKLDKTVDVSNAIVIVCDNIKQASFSKNVGYIVGGVVASGAIIPWIVGDPFHHAVTWTDRAVSIGPDTGSVMGRILASALFVGAGGVIYWLSKSRFNDIASESIDVLRVLLSSPACVIAHPMQAQQALIEVQANLDGREREYVGTYLASGKMHV